MLPTVFLFPYLFTLESLIPTVDFQQLPHYWATLLLLKSKLLRSCVDKTGQLEGITMGQQAELFFDY